jgi:hypothetical protein
LEIREPVSQYVVPLMNWCSQAAGGNQQLKAMLTHCCFRHLRRFGCLLIVKPAPGYAALARIFRSALVVHNSGLVQSAELFRIRNLEVFENSVEERIGTFAETSWDNKSASFSPTQPPRRTRETPSCLDWDGSACISFLSDQIRQFEYSLNSACVDLPVAMTLLEGNNGAAHRKLQTELRKDFGEALRYFVCYEASQVLMQFREYLDREACTLLGYAGANSVHGYNWLMGFQEGQQNLALSCRRKQAVQAFPCAWSLISMPSGRVREAVEMDQPLTKTLAKELGIDEACAKRMNGMRPAWVGFASSPSPEILMAFVHSEVARMPIGRSPKTVDGWRAYRSALVLSKVLRHISVERGENLLAGVAGSWDSLPSDDLARGAAGFDDMIADFHANLAWPVAKYLGLSLWTKLETMELFAGGRNLIQLASASSWWHANQAEVRAHLGTLFPMVGQARSGKGEWPCLHKQGGPWIATNGLVITPLINEASLHDEHVRLGHCVDTYAAKCLYSGSHILSVRTHDGTSIATAEISQSSSGGVMSILNLVKTLAEPPDAEILSLPPSVIQFRASMNGIPPHAAWQALWEYVSAIMTGALDIDIEELQMGLLHRNAMVKEGAPLTCYDYRVEGALVEAWKCYAPMMPKSAQRKGIDSLKDTRLAVR